MWLCWISGALRRLPLVVASGGYALWHCEGCSSQWLLSLRSTGCKHTGFRSCTIRARRLWYTGLAALPHVESFWTRDRTLVLCIGGWIAMYCPTREVLGLCCLSLLSSYNCRSQTWSL